MKTKVILKFADGQYNEWQKGEIGYIDGYVRGGNDVPYACVVIYDRIVMVPFSSLQIVPEEIT